MLSIQPTAPRKCTPNLLPARINHNGPINETRRFWKPETDEKGTYQISPTTSTTTMSFTYSPSTGTQHAYFRGRHLHGTTLALPANYTGAIVNVTDKQVPQAHRQAQDDNDEEEDGDADEAEVVEVQVAEQVGEFDAFVVWEHGGEVDAAQNAYFRGVGEWIGFAESMHCKEGEGKEEEEKSTGKS
jgi:ribonuclease H2 subunit C